MYAMAIHGGAGTLPRHELNADLEQQYRSGLNAALTLGAAALRAGAGSVEAITSAVMALEDNPLFNAGRGAVFTHEGSNELDAAIMDGKTLAAGAVCGLTRIKNPVQLARSVMEDSEYVMLAGTGAEDFASSAGFSFVAPDYFHTDSRWQQLERVRRGDRGISPLTILHTGVANTGASNTGVANIGTVGAVALDVHGNLAAATSTGGMTGKRFKRIGDSPIIGAGTYADNRACAVSATGHGERFIRAAVAHDICARMRYGARTLEQAVHEVIDVELAALQGAGGVIAVDPAGNVSMHFNTEGMFRASVRSGEVPFVAIY